MASQSSPSGTQGNEVPPPDPSEGLALAWSTTGNHSRWLSIPSLHLESPQHIQVTLLAGLGSTVMEQGGYWLLVTLLGAGRERARS